jgi:enoyl-CoA hydratase/carnithine racemase
MSESNEPQFILTQPHDQVIEIILNRPEKRNAIHWPMMQSLSQAIEQAERIPGARAILIRGQGQVFSSGLDLTGLAEMAAVFGEDWQERMTSVTDAFQNVFNKVERCSLPTIALLRGFVLGLGLELALACDFRIAARHTKLGLPEAKMGLIPDVGGTTRLTHLVGPSRAKELILTGRVIDVEIAERWDLVNKIVPEKELDAAGEALVEEIVGCAPLAVRYARQVIDQLSDVDRGLHLEALAQERLAQSEDFMIGVQSMISKTTPQWRGK